MPSKDLTIDQLADIVAGAWEKCPRCHETGGYEPVPHPGDINFGPCFECDGKGSRYVLPDSTREACFCGCHADPQPSASLDWNIAPHGSFCLPECPGWRGSRDVTVWLAVPYSIRFVDSFCYLRLHHDTTEQFAEAATRPEQLLRALAQALGAQGAKLNERS